MTGQSPTHKQLQVNIDDWNIYHKVAKQLTKQIGLKIHTNGAVKMAMQEYLKNHPDIKV